MGKLDTVIRGGTVVTASDTVACDVGIRDGRIVALADDLGSGDAMIDARGHAGAAGRHRQPRASRPASGRGHRHGGRLRHRHALGRAAATRTVLPFACSRGASLRASVMDYHTQGRRQVPRRLRLPPHHHRSVAAACSARSCRRWWRTATPRFKVFMTYEDLVLNDLQLLEVFAVRARDRRAGDGACRELRRHPVPDRAAGAGGQDRAPLSRGLAARSPVEREATHRAITLAELVDVPIMIVHVSDREAMEQIRWAQQRGLKVYGETCPQYLVLTADDLDGLNMEGAKYVCSPPPRDAASQEAFWEGLRDRRVPDLLVRPLPVPLRGPAGQARPQGPHQLPLGAERHSRAWRRGCRSCSPRASSRGASRSNQFVALTADQPRQDVRPLSAQGHDRRRLRCRHRAVGPRPQGDDPQALLHHGADYTPYEGLEVTGWPVMTIVRGMTVVRDGTLVGGSRAGRHVPRDRSPYASPVPRPE